MNSSIPETNIVKKAERSYNTDLVLLIVDLIINIVLGVLALICSFAIPETFIYAMLLIGLAALLTVFDIIEIVVDVIFFSDSAQIYIAYTNTSVIIHYPNEKKCADIPFSAITQIIKKHSGENLFGTMIKRFIGCGNIVINYSINEKKSQVVFGPIKDCDAFANELKNALNRK